METTYNGVDAIVDEPFTLAGYWADRSRWPLLPAERTPAEELHELAVMSVLATWLRRWAPIHMHAALIAGVGVDAVADAAGVPVEEIRDRWEAWASGQVHLWQTSNPARRIGLDPEDAATVRALFNQDNQREGGAR